MEEGPVTRLMRAVSCSPILSDGSDMPVGLLSGTATAAGGGVTCGIKGDKCGATDITGHIGSACRKVAGNDIPKGREDVDCGPVVATGVACHVGPCCPEAGTGLPLGPGVAAGLPLGPGVVVITGCFISGRLVANGPAFSPVGP